jgi:hypothetical protein
MSLINEETLTTISDNMRQCLENLTIGGISEWNTVLSNGYGLGDSNTLVIDMRPADGSKHNVLQEAMSSETLSDAVFQGIWKSGLGISFIDFGAREGNPGFMIVVRLKATP